MSHFINLKDIPINDLRKILIDAKNRKKLRKVNNNRYRISVSKSLNNLFAQIIDDKNRKTLVSASSAEKKTFGDKKLKKKDFSTVLGEILAKRALEKNINKVYFDRGSYKYHGRIKLLAESLRKNGLNF